MGPVPPPWGGVQTHIMSLRERIRARGDRCSILNLTRHRQEDHDDLYFPSSAKEVLARINALKPDVVHVHLGGSLFARQAALFIALSLRPKTKNVFTFHSGGYPSSDEGKAASKMSLRGFSLRRLDAVIGVNQQLIEVFERYGVKRNRLHLIEPFANTLDHDVIAREVLPPEIEEFARAHKTLLLAVGLLEPEYGLDVQLAAFKSVRAQIPDAGLLLIGSGSLHDALRAEIDAHPEREHILLAGDVARPKTLAAIARASVLLRTTHYDGDALSVREALALGTRVLATDNGMRPNGVHLLEQLDADLLARTIPRVLAAKPYANMNENSSSSSPKNDPMAQVLDLYNRLTPNA